MRSCSSLRAVSRITGISRVSRAAAQLLQHLQPRHPRQHQVQHDQVGALQLRRADGLGAAGGGAHAVRLARQVVGHERGDVGLVVHHQDVCARFGVGSGGTRVETPIIPVKISEECRCPEALGKFPPPQADRGSTSRHAPSVDGACNTRVTDRDAACTIRGKSWNPARPGGPVFTEGEAGGSLDPESYQILVHNRIVKPSALQATFSTLAMGRLLLLRGAPGGGAAHPRAVPADRAGMGRLSRREIAGSSGWAWIQKRRGGPHDRVPPEPGERALAGDASPAPQARRSGGDPARGVRAAYPFALEAAFVFGSQGVATAGPTATWTWSWWRMSRGTMPSAIRSPKRSR